MGTYNYKSHHPYAKSVEFICSNVLCRTRSKCSSEWRKTLQFRYYKWLWMNDARDWSLLCLKYKYVFILCWNSGLYNIHPISYVICWNWGSSMWFKLLCVGYSLANKENKPFILIGQNWGSMRISGYFNARVEHMKHFCAEKNRRMGDVFAVIVELWIIVCLGHDGWTADMFALSGVLERLCLIEAPCREECE